MTGARLRYVDRVMNRSVRTTMNCQGDEIGPYREFGRDPCKIHPREGRGPDQYQRVEAELEAVGFTRDLMKLVVEVHYPTVCGGTLGHLFNRTGTYHGLNRLAVVPLSPSMASKVQARAAVTKRADTAAPSSAGNIVSQLETPAKSKAAGALSEREFARAKEKVLGAPS